MIGLKDKELKTERLTLRLIEERDKEPLSLLLKDDSVTAPAGFHPAKRPRILTNFLSTLQCITPQ